MTGFQELKETLLGDEQRRLHRLEGQVLDPAAFSRNVANTLADSVQIAARRSPGLVGALQDPLIEATALAARREPYRLSEALAPVIGPSIRRAIADALRGFLQSIETLASHTLSIRAIRWRLEALRTGAPFERVVLKHALRYEVEEVYLIQKPSGLLIGHVRRADAGERAPDRDVVAAMLLAIEAFAKDAAFADRGEALQTVQMGERTLWLAHGEAALVACAIRGTPPSDLRLLVRETLDGVHALHYEWLKSFRGDEEPFPEVHAALRPLLRSELEPPPAAGATRWLVRALLLGLVVFPAGYALSNWFEGREIRARLEKVLKDRPGIVVTSIVQEQGAFVVRGIADPLAEKAPAIARDADLPAHKLRLELSPYLSLEAPFVLQRVRGLLRPPETVTLAVKDRTLVLSGTATQAWKRRIEPQVAASSFFDAVDTSGLAGQDTREVSRLSRQINTARVYFAENAEPQPHTLGTLERVAGWLRRLRFLGKGLQLRVRLTLAGFSDGTGSDEHNERVRDRRIAWVRAALVGLGDGGLEVLTRSVPATSPKEDLDLRRVDFSVDVTPQSNDGAPDAASRP
ncbi:MAG: hypothetical protein ACT4QB_11865 [Gammaproteobacteria bacterium]